MTLAFILVFVFRGKYHVAHITKADQREVKYIYLKKNELYFL